MFAAGMHRRQRRQPSSPITGLRGLPVPVPAKATLGIREKLRHARDMSRHMFSSFFVVLKVTGIYGYILVSLSMVAKHRMFFLVLDAFGMLHLGLVASMAQKDWKETDVNARRKAGTVNSGKQRGNKITEHHLEEQR